MGMAASQLGLTFMLSRKAAIIGREQNITRQKSVLANDMIKLTQKYHKAMNQKSLKWTNNAGMSYVDMSYANLMRPNDINQRVPHLITDSDGKIVIDSKYLKYAEMISPDGSRGGDWDSVRNQVLSELLGIDPSKMEEFVELKKAVDDNRYEYNQVASLPDDDERKIAAEEAYQASLSAWNAHDNYKNEGDIDFYEIVFSTIADNGWVYNNKVSDTDYLNQMFQNGCYTLTTVEQERTENGFYNHYSTEIASNCDNVVSVYDAVKSNLNTDKYNDAKEQIQRKETRLDEELQNLDTEYKALQEMIDARASTIDKSIELFGKIFTA